MAKILVICGPTATGKTNFGLDLAKELNGEVISADSRQVYKTMDIVTGKDLPENARCITTDIQWKGKNICYYILQGIKVWLYDIVLPNEEFNVSYWRECADLIIKDVLDRGKLPIVVGGTGLYIKALVESLEDIVISPDPVLRSKLEKLSVAEQFDYLKSTCLQRANSLNESDRKNPRRLIRAIEIAQAQKTNSIRDTEKNSYLSIGLTAPQELLFKRIDQKIKTRINLGARAESDQMLKKYDPHLPSMTASGYGDLEKWSLHEKQYARRQRVWFTKQPNIVWFDVSIDGWQAEASRLIKNWYN